jgi:hypothetical protein
MIIALFLVGGAFAGVWAWFIGPHRSGRGLVFGGLALVAGATLYAAGLTGGDVPTVALTIGLALLAGLGSSAIWPLLVERIPRERIGAVFALESLGYLLGVAGCQVVLLFLGYQATGLLAILALCLATGLLLRWTRPALDLAGSA